MTWQERSRLGAYLSFAGGLAAFLLLFIPSLFGASLPGVLVALGLMLGLLVMMLRFGRRGFDVAASVHQEPHAPSPPVPLDPRHTDLDDENWRRMHGG